MEPGCGERDRGALKEPDLDEEPGQAHKPFSWGRCKLPEAIECRGVLPSCRRESASHTILLQLDEVCRVHWLGAGNQIVTSRAACRRRAEGRAGLYNG